MKYQVEQQPFFKPIAGSILDVTLNNLGFENPNKDIMIHKYRVDLLKNKVDNYINVIKELDSLDIDNMSEEDKEFFKKIKEELVRDYYKRHFIQ